MAAGSGPTAMPAAQDRQALVELRRPRRRGGAQAAAQRLGSAPWRRLRSPRRTRSSGRWWRPPGPAPGPGLVGFTDRVEAVGGTLSIQRRAGRRTGHLVEFRSWRFGADDARAATACHEAERQLMSTRRRFLEADEVEVMDDEP